MEKESLLMQVSNLPTYFSTPEWFQAKIINAQESWVNLPLPSIERAKIHRWSLFSQMVVDESAMVEPLTTNLIEGLNEADDLNKTMIIHAGNYTIMESLPSDLKEAGLIVMDLFDALAEYPDLIRENFGQVIEEDADKLVSYNLAGLNGGIFIYVPKNMHVSLPIESLLVVDARFEQAFNKRLLIICDENASVDYLEKIQSIGNQKVSATMIVEAVIKDHARLKYMAIDSLGENVTAYLKRYAKTGRDAKIDWALGSLNNGNAILDLDTYLIGNGSESQVSIISITSGKQTQVIDSKVVNIGYHTIGNIFQHGVILESSTLTFNGIGLIENGAKFADAQQESRVLMLSDKARGDANPILLIEEFEVTAGHAASIGQVDAQQLHYLMSRGLTRQVAEYLVIRGFLGPVLLSMPSQKVREELVSFMDQKLASLNQ